MTSQKLFIYKTKDLNKIDLQNYDYYVVAFSGGKDSIACVLYLIEMGIDKLKIELWHHDVDGREGSTLMDWACTRDYCKKFAQALDIKIYFSWKQGGIEREMLRENSLTAPIMFETPDEGIKSVGGVRGKNNTRRKFPQVSPDLSVRWCSAYMKIDVGSAALRNQARFIGKRTLFVTGERAEESASRAKYESFEPDRADNRNGKRVKRHIDHWRPVHQWLEGDIWIILERHRINPHPAYKLGWGRVSCAACIFGSKDQWASLNYINPKQVETISDYEKEFGLTINRKKSIPELVSDGTPYNSITDEMKKEALSEIFEQPIIIKKWTLPAGAFGDSCGPV